MSTYPDFTRILNQKLTEQERSATWLAKRLDLHPGTVNRWLNQELRPATPELVARIADLLCIHKVQERQALMVAAGYGYVEGQQPPAPAPKPTNELPSFLTDPPRHNLPTSPTAFVGREEELAQLTAQLAQPDVRLLTVVGFGGIGKTRLALAMAARLVDDFADGVWFVSLVGIDATASQNALNPLVMGLANVLSVVFLGQEEPEEQLLGYLHDKEMLILFDNVEHLLGLSDFFSRLLSRCPNVKLLVTSRERLRLVEEWLFPLHGLAMPAAESEITADTLQAMTHFDAIRLFEQNARRVQPAFDLNANIQAVLHICQLVEAIPLGIELAAAWLRQMPLTQIASEIEQSSDILHSPLRNQPARHRSFRTVFEHSWNLLTPDEQEVLMGLSVFRGGFCRPEAQAVTAATLQTLTGLVDKSFVRLNPSGRYDIHERIRQYAGEKLREVCGREERLRERHANIYLDYLCKFGGQLLTSSDVESLRAISSEFENIASFINWILFTNDVAKLLACIKPWADFCDMTCQFRLGVEVFKTVVVCFRTNLQKSNDDITYLNVAISLTLLGKFQSYIGASAESKESLLESERILKQFESLVPCELATTLTLLGGSDRENASIVYNRLKKALALSENCCDKFVVGSVFYALGHVSWRYGNYDYAESCLQKCLSFFESKVHLGFSLLNLGGIEKSRQRYVEAEKLLLSARQYFQEVNHAEGLAYLTTNLAEILTIQNRFEEAESQLKYGLLLAQRIGSQVAYRTVILKLGELFESRGNFSTAQQYFLQVLDITEHTIDSVQALIGLGRLSIRENQLQAGIDQLLEAIQLSLILGTVSFTLEIISEFTFCYLDRHANVQAVTLAYFVQNHPSCGDTAHRTVAKLLDKLTNSTQTVSPEVIESAKQHAQSLTLEAVTAQLLGEFS